MKLGEAVLGICLLSVIACPKLVIAQTKNAHGIEAFQGPTLSVSEMQMAIEYIESHIEMPNEAEPISIYGRYYAQNNGIVYAVYAKPWAHDRWVSGVHSVQYNDLPLVFDGGCNYIDVAYIPSRKSITAHCHGFA